MMQLELFESFATSTENQTSQSGKMCRGHFPVTAAETLLSSSKRWSTSGRVTLRGECWTRKGLEYPSDVGDVSLSQILEANVPRKYWLSARAAIGILKRAERRGKKIPLSLKEALEVVAATE